MGRAGISYHHVSQAAEELQMKGVNPTVDTVRELLKSGSKTTIAKYLKEWKQNTTPSLVTAGIPSSLQESIKTLWGALQAQSDEALDTQAQEHEAELTALQEELNALKIAIGDKDSLIARLEKQCDVLSSQVEASVQTISDLNDTLRQKDSTITRLSDQNDLFKMQIETAQSNLLHFQEQAQKQREKERLDFDHAKAKDEQQIFNLGLELASAKALLAEFKTHNSKLSAENKQLTKEADEYRVQIAKMNVLQEKQEQQIDTYQTTISNLKGEIEDNLAKLRSVTDENIKLTAELNASNKQADEANSNSRKLISEIAVIKSTLQTMHQNERKESK